jgi:hypothetical protein
MTMNDAPVDAMGPWTIKAISTETREAVIKAARKEGLTVGQWIERRMREWITDGEPVRVSPGRAESASAENLVRLVALARDLAPDDPKGTLLTLACTVVRRALRAEYASVTQDTVTRSPAKRQPSPVAAIQETTNVEP